MTTVSVRILARDIEGFLEFKRALGHPYRRGEFTIRSFERFALRRADASGEVDLKATLHAWLSRVDGRKPVTVAVELGTIRQFCLYRRRSDPQSFVPGREWAPQSAESTFLPYIFSYDEVVLLLEAVSKLRGPNVWHPCIRVLLLILYCTGLRIGEAVRLQLRDVDLKDRSFTVRESKGKTRIVPFRADLAREIAEYLHQRRQIAKELTTAAVLVRPSGRALTVAVASNVIRQLLRCLGLKPPKGRVGPRPYDMRHTFAVHRLTEWYREGVDVHSRLPWLSAYMGHDNILGTEIYLTATPELTAVAAQRFARHFRSARRR